MVSTALALGLLRRRKEQYVVVSVDNPCTRRNGEKLGSCQFSDRDIPSIEHLDGLPV
jgi:hypothetical protein